MKLPETLVLAWHAAGAEGGPAAFGAVNFLLPDPFGARQDGDQDPQRFSLLGHGSPPRR